MGGVNGWIPFEVSAQDWAKMIPLEVVGPWGVLVAVEG